jgi:hypothetical protein
LPKVVWALRKQFGSGTLVLHSGKILIFYFIIICFNSDDNSDDDNDDNNNDDNNNDDSDDDSDGDSDDDSDDDIDDDSDDDIDDDIDDYDNNEEGECKYCSNKI